MPISLKHVTLDCADVQTVAGFWSSAFDKPVDEGSNDFFASIDEHLDDRPSWFFIKVPEPKTIKNRLHIDFGAAERETEVSRLEQLGAARLSEHSEWGAVWTVMADPEGNEFCVGQK